MALTREELKNAHNNVMAIIESRIMSMVGCDRTTANLIANEVLSLDREAEFLLNNPEESPCGQCFHYVMDSCMLNGDGCQTDMWERFENK